MIQILIIINVTVLACGFYALVRLANRGREVAAAERFYNAWEEHVRGGFEVSKPVADQLAVQCGLRSAPPLADDTDEFLGIVPHSQLREGPDGKAKPWERMVAILNDADLGNSVDEAILYLQSAKERMTHEHPSASAGRPTASDF